MAIIQKSSPKEVRKLQSTQYEDILNFLYTDVRCKTWN
jgi:hypothetical protein